MKGVGVDLVGTSVANYPRGLRGNLVISGTVRFWHDIEVGIGAQKRRGTMEKVLIIEDDPDFSKSLELVLGLHDLTAVRAPSAEEALAQLEKRDGNIDLVFMDIKLPGMNGIECLQEIHSRWSAIPCVIMTGFRDNERHERARSAGAAEILLKPFRMEQFLSLVKAYI